MNIKEIKLAFILIMFTVFSSNHILGQQEKLHLNEWITSWHLLGLDPIRLN